MGVVEIWQDCPDYEGYYEVSNLGRVRSVDRVLPCAGLRGRFHRGRVLSPNRASNGYLTVQLRGDGGVGRRELVHRLVARAFLAQPAGKDVVNHVDFDPANNRLANLEWVTQSENLFHASRGGRMRGPSPRLVTDSLVAAVRAHRAAGGSERVIARALGVSHSTVHKICTRGDRVRTVEAARGGR